MGTAHSSRSVRSGATYGIAAAGLSFGAVLAIAAVVALRLCARRAKAPRAGSRRRGYEAASKDAGADEDDDDEPVAGPQFDIEDEDEETTALVGFVIDGDVYLRDGDSGIVYASERDAVTGELVPVGRWVDGTLVPLASAPGWISADGGERVIVHHF